jgi:hypothetical protein
MLNNTLRGGNYIDLFMIRIVINRLTRELENYKEEEEEYPQKLYRGTYISKSEIELWKEMKDPLML